MSGSFSSAPCRSCGAVAFWFEVPTCGVCPVACSPPPPGFSTPVDSIVKLSDHAEVLREQLCVLTHVFCRPPRVRQGGAADRVLACLVTRLFDTARVSQALASLAGEGTATAVVPSRSNLVTQSYVSWRCGGVVVESPPPPPPNAIELCIVVGEGACTCRCVSWSVASLLFLCFDVFLLLTWCVDVSRWFRGCAVWTRRLCTRRSRRRRWRATVSRGGLTAPFAGWTCCLAWIRWTPRCVRCVLS